MESLEELEAVKSPEEEKDLFLKSEMAIKLETMTKTEGWKQIFAPWLQQMQRGFEKGILSCKEHADFLQAQQNINLIDTIFNFIKNGIAVGKEAENRLRSSIETK